MADALATRAGTAGLVLADAIRVAAAVSVVVGLGWFDGVAGALFFLVLGGTMIPRALGVPVRLDTAYSATLLLAAWASVLDWYVRFEWLDLVIHAAATGLVAAMTYLLLVRLAMVAAVDEPSLPRVRAGSAVIAASLGVALATLWEFGEWIGHTYLDDRIQVGYSDTIGDLAAGTAGALTAAVLLARGRSAGARR
ncbi:hypothetical protein EHW97_13070 [Aeromicrobium camelliae]|uniref:DUF2238 domain-containing protein n=1 Tax=Aeromicrobium camelliae TaxID=1538144 RepID=A0A3N6YXJ8_9ACTN|nr:hypothetical protein [Aeromicrobium camelliae]RQN02491.1 hypothetical protein EHW97_13070 [Aeromicrobium camelliae]